MCVVFILCSFCGMLKVNSSAFSNAAVPGCFEDLMPSPLAEISTEVCWPDRVTAPDLSLIVTTIRRCWQGKTGPFFVQSDMFTCICNVFAYKIM